MIIKAIVQLQTLPAARCLIFVRQGEHAAGEVSLFEVTAESWDGVRRVLKTFDVVGAHGCGRKTAVSFTEDAGTATGSLRLLDNQPLSKKYMQVQSRAER